MARKLVIQRHVQRRAQGSRAVLCKSLQAKNVQIRKKRDDTSQQSKGGLPVNRLRNHLNVECVMTGDEKDVELRHQCNVRIPATKKKPQKQKGKKENKKTRKITSLIANIQ